VLAWSNAHDEAISLLEQLSGDTCSLGPAAIVRDPTITIPLKTHPRYTALETRLNAELEKSELALIHLFDRFKRFVEKSICPV
jgi:hypothetical protein